MPRFTEDGLVLRRITSSLVPTRPPLDERTAPVLTVAPVRSVITRTDELRSAPPLTPFTRLEETPVRDALDEPEVPADNDSRRVEAAAEVR